MNAVPEMIAIVGGTLIDGNGGTPIDDGVILIEGKRIVAVGDGSTQVPGEAKRIVATGKFVIPGLMDAAVFLVDGITPTTLIRYEGRYDELAIEAAQIALKNGVTTVFDTWGPRDYLIKARNAISQGLCVGSRIYLAGNLIGLDGPFSDDFRPQFKEGVYDAFAARINSVWQQNVGQKLIWMSPEEVRQEIREYVQSGIDYLNYAVTDHRAGAYRYIVFSPRVQQVIVEEAHREGLPVGGFRPVTGEALHLAVDAGSDVLQIPESLAEQLLAAETAALVAQQQIPCIVAPATTKALEWYRQRAKDNLFFRMFETMELSQRALLQAGAVMLLGTYGAVYSAENSSFLANNPPETIYALGEGHFNWLLAMQNKDMEPMAALMAATRNIARAYKVDKNLGTLERGKLADLVILDRNPLEKAENYRSISLVIKEGQVIDRDALPTQRLITAPIVESK